MLIKEIENCLNQVRDPYLLKPLSELKAINSITINEKKIEIELFFHYPFSDIDSLLLSAIQEALRSFDCEIDLRIKTTVDAHIAKQGVQAIPQIKNLIAVASGKGGVGKSLITNQLALALLRMNPKVGLLDADIYGPSQPTMLSTNELKPDIQNNRFKPINALGLQTMSIGYLTPKHEALVWRGPMIAKAMQQMLSDTDWGDLDYLMVDLPPGTGDVQLTLVQKTPLSGVVLVTTPQEMSLIDVRRAARMFQKLEIPILGIIENMSVYHCRSCQHPQKIFGEGGASKLSKEFNIPVLGEVPLDAGLGEKIDSGEREENYFKLFDRLALQVAANLSLQPKSYAHRFPKIEVRNN